MMKAVKKGGARAVADLTEGTILALVDIGAPPERVFAALTTPEELVRWWGSPDSYRTTDWTAELRVGGRWRAGGRSADGSAFAVEGEFLEIDPPRVLKQTWKPDWDGGHVTTITYRLDAVPGGTRVTVRHEGFAGRAESCAMHASGWERVLEWLSGYASPAEAEAPKFFLCRLLPPRPSFALDMSAEERRIMVEHAAYWTEHLERGKAIVFGPVLDPKGPWGVGVVAVKDEAEVRAFEQGDPAIRANIGMSYEVLPMMRAVYRA